MKKVLTDEQFRKLILKTIKESLVIDQEGPVETEDKHQYAQANPLLPKLMK